MRRKRNQILEILNVDGVSRTKYYSIGHVFSKFYKNLFSSSNPTQIQDCLQVIHHCIKAAMNSILLNPYSVEEVERALFQMSPLKAPSPNGFSAGFYQKFQHVVGSKVCESILSILNGNGDPKCLNYTYLTLIPKLKFSKKVSNFRPISLCNVKSHC